jgi:hypothetical protein
MSPLYLSCSTPEAQACLSLRIHVVEPALGWANRRGENAFWRQEQDEVSQNRYSAENEENGAKQNGFVE